MADIPEEKAFRMKSESERLWSRVILGPPDVCWPWQGYKTKFGHGQMGFRGKIEYTHRVAWREVYGPIPEGMQVCHRCDNPRCCNPSHLFLGTQADNNKDMHEKKRSVHFTKPNCFPTGEKSCRSKLSRAQVVEAMEMVSRKIPARIIAEKFGVTRSAISKIANGRSWKKELSV